MAIHCRHRFRVSFSNQFDKSSLVKRTDLFCFKKRIFHLSGFNSPPLAVKYVKLFLKPDTPLLAAGSLHLLFRSIHLCMHFSCYK